MRTKRILVAAPVAFAASRQKLRGIYRYAADRHDWDIVLARTDDSLTPRIVDDCLAGAFDGIIISSPEAIRGHAAFARVKAPLVVLESATHNAATILHADDEAIGKMAAEYLCGLGAFQSYAFVHDEKRRSWSVGRCAGYSDALKRRNRVPVVYDPARDSLGDFLLRLPKPTAVFAAWDQLAADVIRACHENRLSIPSDVAVLGVDDDDLICESVRPALSSILVDRIRMGYRAAEILDALMRRPSSPRFATSSSFGPLRVISRESTQAISSAAALAKRAAAYIKENAGSDITPVDIARHLHVSRRLLDLRFVETHGMTPADAIRAQKLICVRRLLKSSGLSDARIAEQCGFRNVNALRNLFRRETGMTMRTFAGQSAKRTK